MNENSKQARERKSSLALLTKESVIIMTATIITIIIVSFLLAIFTNAVFFTEQTFDEIEILREAQEQEFDLLCDVFMKA